MIVKLAKYIFMGARADLDEFFQRAQEAGFIQFFSSSPQPAGALHPTLQKLYQAMKVVRRLPLLEPYEGRVSPERAEEIASNILLLREHVEALTDERKFLDSEIARVAPLGDFALADLAYIEKEGKRKVQFFCRKLSDLPEAMPDGLFFVGTDYDLDYFISVQKEPISPPSMIEMQVLKPISALTKRLMEVERELACKEAGLKEQAKYQDYLRGAYFELLSELQLESAKADASSVLEERIFSIEGWVPLNRVHELKRLQERLAVEIEEVTQEEEDRVPTCLENRGMGKVGEDLVRIYDTPASTDRDPSLFVLWAFVLFFSIIMADGGYGLLYLALAAYLRYKFPSWTGKKKRFVQMLAVLATGCIVWGCFTASFFGLPIRPDSALGKISIVQRLATKRAAYHMEHKDEVYREWVKEYPQLTGVTSPLEFLTVKSNKPQTAGVSYEILNEFSEAVLMEIALMIGVLHIALSLARYLLRSWSALGWILFLVGGYLYFPSVVQATSMVHYLGWMRPAMAYAIGLELLWGGIGLALLLALIQRRWKGLGEIANAIQLFSDVLSYLRLYALGLAGAIMASTFNDMGVKVGLVFGGFVILAGHAINILLSSMGGVIHGLRLNFIEWYHYSFEGGGIFFRPLRKLRSDED